MGGGGGGTSPALLAVLLLTKPRMGLATFATRTHCSLMFRLLSGPSLQSYILSVVLQAVLLDRHILFQVQDVVFDCVQL